MTDDDWTKSGVVNASLNGLDSRNAYTHKPKVGFDGHIIIAKSGIWYETDNKGFLNNIRTSIVFHELADNYYRTAEGMNYNEAHDKATRREGFFSIVDNQELFHRLHKKTQKMDSTTKLNHR